MSLSDILTSHKIDIIVEDDILFVVASDLSQYLKLKNIRMSIADFHQHEKTHKKILTKGGMQKKTVLTVSGMKRLLSNSRMEKSISLWNELGFECITKYIPKELTFITQIQEAFRGTEMIFQHKVINTNYHVDIFFVDYNLVVEFDENRHKYYIDKDLKRQNEIENILKCKFIRINEDESVFKAINEIHKFIVTQSTQFP